jgi:hypothetical protein
MAANKKILKKHNWYLGLRRLAFNKPRLLKDQKKLKRLKGKCIHITA